MPVPQSLKNATPGADGADVRVRAHPFAPENEQKNVSCFSFSYIIRACDRSQPLVRFYYLWSAFNSLQLLMRITLAPSVLIYVTEDEMFCLSSTAEKGGCFLSAANFRFLRRVPGPGRSVRGRQKSFANSPFSLAISAYRRRERNIRNNTCSSMYQNRGGGCRGMEIGKSPPPRGTKNLGEVEVVAKMDSNCPGKLGYCPTPEERSAVCS